MSKREIISQELETLPEPDLDKLLAFLRAMREMRADSAAAMLAAESCLAKDWLSPEEDSAWANL